MRIFTRTTEDKDEYCDIINGLKEYKYLRDVSGGSNLVNYYVINEYEKIIRRRGFLNKKITKQK